jgi:hypothetical protein
MGTKIISLSLGKRLSYGLALSGILLSAFVFGLATAETTDTKVVKPVRILLTDDTPDSTLSVRRKVADQRNISKLYNNELRPKKVEPKQVVEAEIKPAPPAEKVTPKVVTPKVVTPKVVTPKVTPKVTPTIVEPVEEISPAKPKKNGLDSIVTTLTSPKFNIIADIDAAFKDIGDELASATKSPSNSSTSSSTQNNHKSKYRQMQSNREHRPSAASTNHEKSDLPDIPSFAPVLPSMDLSKVDLFGDIESAFTTIRNEFSSATAHATPPHVSKYDSKLKNPGRFTSRYTNRSTAAPVHMPTLGSLDGIQFPEIKLSDINSIFAVDSPPSIDEDLKTPTATPDELQEKTKESAKDSVKEKRSAAAKEPRSIITLLGLEGLRIPEFNNPFAVGTGIKETKETVEPVETKDPKPALDDGRLDPDETVTSELPSLRTDPSRDPGVKQVPPLAPKKIPNAPTTINEEDKSASRNSHYKTLVNPDSFLPRSSAVPVSVRISDTLNR